MLMLLETLMEESPEVTLMLTPMDSFNRCNMLLMVLDSVLLTLVCLLLQSMTELLPPSTQSHLLPQFSLVLLLNQFRIPRRLLKPRLLTLLLLLLLPHLLRERDVRPMLLSLVELPESSLPPLPSSTTHQQFTRLPMLLILMLVLAMLVLAMVWVTLVLPVSTCKL